MHTRHAQVQFVSECDDAGSHNRVAGRDAGLFDEHLDFFRSTAAHNASAEAQHRPFAFLYHACDLFDERIVRYVRGVRTHRTGRFEVEYAGCDILGNIHKHRPLPPAVCNLKRRSQRVGQPRDIPHRIRMLGDGACNSRDVHFLKAVFADQARADIGCNGHERNAVQECSRNSRNEIRRSRSARRETDAHLAGGARISVRGMHGTALIGGQIVLDLTLPLAQRIVDVKRRAARISKNILYTLLDQHFYDGFCTCHFHTVCLLSKKKPLPFTHYPGEEATDHPLRYHSSCLSVFEKASHRRSFNLPRDNGRTRSCLHRHRPWADCSGMTFAHRQKYCLAPADNSLELFRGLLFPINA